MSCCDLMYDLLFFFFKQKTAYEMRISDGSSDVCYSVLHRRHRGNTRRSAFGKAPAAELRLDLATTDLPFGWRHPCIANAAISNDLDAAKIGRASCREIG